MKVYTCTLKYKIKLGIPHQLPPSHDIHRKKLHPHRPPPPGCIATQARPLAKGQLMAEGPRPAPPNKDIDKTGPKLRASQPSTAGRAPAHQSGGCRSKPRSSKLSLLNLFNNTLL